MAIIFGVLNSEKEAVAAGHLLAMSSATEIYAVDGSYLRPDGRIGFGFQPFHTHPRSKLECEPLQNQRGDILVLDGRLDNHAELGELLGICSTDRADSAIMIAAFEQWGEGCFERFVGDWALALWSKLDQTLYLARDHAGTRTLYFEQSDRQIRWSTALASFFVDSKSHALDRCFALCYLAGTPTGDLTPYKGVRAIPAGHYLRFRHGVSTIKAHWRCLVRDVVVYKTESEYQEHLLALLKQAVGRRDLPGVSILAHLSGGIDSSSVVCLSDQLRHARGCGPKDLIDTISYFDDSEPSWDEKPYFTAVESARGKSGIHISTQVVDRLTNTEDPGYLWPGGDHRTKERINKLEGLVGTGRYRVIFSGMGGDELLGGRPDPLPELSDYLVTFNCRSFFYQGFQWCLPDRTPLLKMISKVFRFCAELYLRPPRQGQELPQWVLLSGGERPTKKLKLSHTLGLRPSAIYNSLVWDSLLNTLPHLGIGTGFRYEYCYPYLDRDLVDFLLRVPPIYLRKPGRRRYLMRKALELIVPEVILERKRKAFLVRSQILALEAERKAFAALFSHSVLAAAGWINLTTLKAAFERATTNCDAVSASALLRTIAFESWLQGSRIRLSF